MSTTRRTRVFGTVYRKMGKFRPVLRYRSKKIIKQMSIPEKVIPESKIVLPKGIKINITPTTFTLSKGENTLSRIYPSAMLNITDDGKNILLKGKSHNVRVRTIIGTFNAHITNMLKGLEEPFKYNLRITSVHFPMTAKVQNNVFELKNFLGGKEIRKAKIPTDVEISVNGSEIELSSRDIEKAGMTATRIEQLTQVNKRDRRVFQDGIFLTVKAGRKLL